jgi:hypothetical protein
VSYRRLPNLVSPIPRTEPKPPDHLMLRKFDSRIEAGEGGDGHLPVRTSAWATGAVGG